MTRPIFFALHDAGGARALAPVIDGLRPNRPVVVWAHPYATTQIAPPDRICEAISDGEARAALEELGPCVLVVGTSWGNETIDKRFTLASRDLGIPSVGVLDFWSNYRERFTARTDGAGELLFLPDALAVMDDLALGDMVTLGFPTERLWVTGNPAYDRLPRPEGRGAARRALAAQLGLPAEACWVLFLSQPLADLYGRDGTSPRFLGYTEDDAARALAEALRQGTAPSGRPVSLLVRYHPKEPPSKIAGWPACGPRPIPAQDPPLHDLLLAADVVVGMSTAALIDAHLLGRPAVSLQPNLSVEDSFVLTRHGRIPLVTDGGSLAATLRELLSAIPGPSGAAISRQDGTAAARVGALIDRARSNRGNDRLTGSQVV